MPDGTTFSPELEAQWKLQRAAMTAKPQFVDGTMQARLAVMRAGIYGTMRFRKRTPGQPAMTQTLLGGSPEPKKTLLGV